jgi:hypothetical protein
MGEYGYSRAPMSKEKLDRARNRDIVGGAAAGASAGSVFGPVGTAIGGLLGGLLGRSRDPER